MGSYVKHKLRNNKTTKIVYGSPSFSPTGPDSPSGFGFELTFRLKRRHGEESPPIWPATLMQALARYVFQSGIMRRSNSSAIN